VTDDDRDQDDGDRDDPGLLGREQQRRGDGTEQQVLRLAPVQVVDRGHDETER
jgi:hypothetical protein